MLFFVALKGMIEGVDEASIRAYAEDIAECLRTSLAQA